LNLNNNIEGPQGGHCYIYEFNEELVICTRRLSDGSGGSEPSLPLTAPDNWDDSDIVQATWMTDPRVHEVPGLTIQRLKLLLMNRGGSSCGELWASTHAVTKHKIYIQQRVDRHLLVSLYEQTRQVLQLRLDLFGPIADQRQQLPKDSDIVQKGVSLMQPIAEKFCRGDICKDDLKGARDFAVKELGLAPAMKKPACCKEEPIPDLSEQEEVGVATTETSKKKKKNGIRRR
jgi:hypothetical protein